jgi:hypothetical protein
MKAKSMVNGGATSAKKKGEMELSGMVSPTPTIQCWPEPVPYIFNGVAMQMLQQPSKIIFLYPTTIKFATFA